MTDFHTFIVDVYIGSGIYGVIRGGSGISGEMWWE
jgi:hypothetical protein